MALTTPADGQVIRRDGEVGDFIPSNQPVFYLAKSGSPLRISADVDEEDIPLVKAGDKVLIKADAFPDRIFDGQVSDVTPKGDPIARSYRVRIALPSDTALKIGMTAVEIGHESRGTAQQRDGTIIILLRKTRDSGREGQQDPQGCASESRSS